jgi:MoaA/NifB/PqqE/SkfB family radical SAM enzyme
MLNQAFIKRLYDLWVNDRDNLKQKVRKKLRNKLPLDKMFFDSGKAMNPINLTFEMTHLCNLSCYMCDLYGTDEETSSPRSDTYRPNELLDLADYQRIIDEVKKFKPSISLTGGEPMLCPHTIPFIKMARKEGLVVTMVSNLTMMQGKEKEIVESGLQNLTCSIDGVGEDHDYVRGQKGCFDTFEKVLNTLIEEKEKVGTALPALQFNVTLTGRNLDRLLPILHYAEEKNVARVIYSHLWYWDEGMVKHHNQEYGKLAPVETQNLRALEDFDVDVLRKELNKIKKDPAFESVSVKFLPDLYDDQLEAYYTNSEGQVRPGHHCLSPWMNTRILPNGDVIPCIDSFWGNLKKDSFADTWNSAEAQKFRSALKEPGVMPGCMRCCGLYSYE